MINHTDPPTKRFWKKKEMLVEHRKKIENKTLFVFVCLFVCFGCVIACLFGWFCLVVLFVCLFVRLFVCLFVSGLFYFIKSYLLCHEQSLLLFAFCQNRIFRMSLLQPIAFGSKLGQLQLEFFDFLGSVSTHSRSFFPQLLLQSSLGLFLFFGHQIFGFFKVGLQFRNRFDGTVETKFKKIWNLNQDRKCIEMKLKIL